MRSVIVDVVRHPRDMRLWPVALLTALMLSVAGCGGGGGSNSSSIPTDSPALPQPVYTGPTYGATLDEATAPQFAYEFFWAANVASNYVGIAIDDFTQFPLPSGPSTTTYSGPLGGSGVLTSNRATGGVAWYEFSYSNYGYTDSQQGPVFLNGTLTVIFTPPDQYSIGFDNYEAIEHTHDIHIQGNVVTKGSGSSTTSANLDIKDTKTGFDTYLSNLSNTTVNGEVTYKGRLYYSQAGYVDATTIVSPLSGCIEVDINYDPNECYPSNGDIALKGVGTTILHLEPLNHEDMFLGLDTNGDGIIDLGARFDETKSELDSGQHDGLTLSGPNAYALQVNDAQTGKAMSVDGRYSFMPGGWIDSYSWDLIETPPGSSATLTDTTSVEPGFTPDVAGPYLLKLTVHSDTGSSQSLLQLDVVDPTLGQGLPAFYVLPSSAAVATGSTVLIDDSLSGGLTSTGGLWALTAPSGSSATLSNPDGPYPSFTPDIPGYYEVWPDPEMLGDPTVGDHMMIGVGASYYLSPAAQMLSGFEAGFDGQMQTGHFDASGFIGVAGLADVAGSNGEVWLLQRIAGSHAGFRNPSFLSFPSGAHPVPRSGLNDDMEAVDLNGDGLTDIVALAHQSTSQLGAVVFLSQPDGSYQSSSLDTAIGGCSQGMGMGPLVASSPSTTMSVVLFDRCNSTLDTYVWNGSVFAAPVQVASVPTGALSFQLGDVTGDGKADAIFCVNGSSSSNAELVVEPGDGTGNFGTASSYSLHGKSCGFIRVADLANNGRGDVVVTDDSYVEVFMQASNGTLSANSPLSTENGAVDITIADFNKDGYPDIAVVDTCNSNCPGGESEILTGIYWGSNSGPTGSEFIEPATSLLGSTASGTALAAGDLDGDGLPDLVLNTGVLYFLYDEPLN